MSPELKTQLKEFVSRWTPSDPRQAEEFASNLTDLLSAVNLGRVSGCWSMIEPPDAFPDHKWTIWKEESDEHLGRGKTLREAIDQARVPASAEKK